MPSHGESAPIIAIRLTIGGRFGVDAGNCIKFRRPNWEDTYRPMTTIPRTIPPAAHAINCLVRSLSPLGCQIETQSMPKSARTAEALTMRKRAPYGSLLGVGGIIVFGLFGRSILALHFFPDS